MAERTRRTRRADHRRAGGDRRVRRRGGRARRPRSGAASHRRWSATPRRRPSSPARRRPRRAAARRAQRLRPFRYQVPERVPRRYLVPPACDAEGGNRTHTPRRELDFESVASASSATSAGRIVAALAHDAKSPSRTLRPNAVKSPEPWRPTLQHRLSRRVSSAPASSAASAGSSSSCWSSLIIKEATVSRPSSSRRR